MSEELSMGWAEPAAMQFWRDDVKRRADEWLATYPNARRRTEIREPEKAARALYLLMETERSQTDIAQEVGLANREIGTLLYHRPELWEKRRPMLAAKLAATAEQLVDAMDEKLQRIRENPDSLDEIPVKDLALAIGIVSDKAATFNGMATAVVEHRSGPSIEEAMRFRDEIRQRVANAKVIDV